MKVSVYTAQQLSAETRKANKAGREDAISMMLMLTVWALIDELALSQDDIQRVLSFMQDKTGFLSEREFTISDMAKMIKTETGIDISFNADRLR